METTEEEWMKPRKSV